MNVLPGREWEYEPDTKGHIDGICFFSRPGQVVFGLDEEMSPMMTENLHVLMRQRDAKGRKLEVVTVLNPRTKHFPKDAPIDYCSEYVQGIFVNGGFIMPAGLDVDRDIEAVRIFQGLWPDREVVMVSMKTIGYKAGGLHCMTREEPE